MQLTQVHHKMKLIAELIAEIYAQNLKHNEQKTESIHHTSESHLQYLHINS